MQHTAKSGGAHGLMRGMARYLNHAITSLSAQQIRIVEQYFLAQCAFPRGMRARAAHPLGVQPVRRRLPSSRRSEGVRAAIPRKSLRLAETRRPARHARQL
jgi:hypothetical protein